MTSRSGIIPTFYPRELESLLYEHERAPTDVDADRRMRRALVERPCRRRAGAIRRRDRRVAVVRRRSAEPSLLAAQPDHRGELQRARGRLALPDRQPWTP